MFQRISILVCHKICIFDLFQSPGKIYMMSCRGALFSRTSGSPPFRSNCYVFGQVVIGLCTHPEDYMGWNLKSWWFGWKMIFRISRGAGILSFQPLIFRGVDRKGCWFVLLCFVFFPRFSTSKWIKQHKRLEKLVTLVGFCEGILRIGWIYLKFFYLAWVTSIHLVISNWWCLGPMSGKCCRGITSKELTKRFFGSSEMSTRLFTLDQ